MKHKKTYKIPVILVRLMATLLITGGIATITFISIFLSAITHVSLFGIISVMGIFTTGMLWMLLNQMESFKSIDAKVIIEKNDIDEDIEKTKSKSNPKKEIIESHN